MRITKAAEVHTALRVHSRVCDGKSKDRLSTRAEQEKQSVRADREAAFAPASAGGSEEHLSVDSPHRSRPACFPAHLSCHTLSFLSQLEKPSCSQNLGTSTPCPGLLILSSQPPLVSGVLWFTQALVQPGCCPPQPPGLSTSTDQLLCGLSHDGDPSVRNQPCARTSSGPAGKAWSPLDRC